MVSNNTLYCYYIESYRINQELSRKKLYFVGLYKLLDPKSDKITSGISESKNRIKKVSADDSQQERENCRSAAPTENRGSGLVL